MVIHHPRSLHMCITDSGPNKLKTTLTNKGLKAMESIGKDFNIDEHEAITEIPAPTPELAGKVIDEVEKGYFLNDKLIRFAKVVVGK